LSYKWSKDGKIKKDRKIEERKKAEHERKTGKKLQKITYHICLDEEL
jgi:hypothetical protein